MIVYRWDDPDGIPPEVKAAFAEAAREGAFFVALGITEGYALARLDIRGIGECHLHINQPGFGFIGEGLDLLLEHHGASH